MWVWNLNGFLKTALSALSCPPSFSPTFSISKSGTTWLSHKILTQKPYKKTPNFSSNTPSPPSPVTLGVKGQPLRALLHTAYIFQSCNANVTVHMNMQEEDFEKKVNEQTVHSGETSQMESFRPKMWDWVNVWDRFDEIQRSEMWEPLAVLTRRKLRFAWIGKWVTLKSFKHNKLVNSA